MEESLKQLLLKDLSARLPYKVKCNVYNRIGTLTGVNDYGAEIDYGNGQDTTCEIQYCLPYLRPMSSMTEKECKTLWNISATLENNLIEILPNIPYYIEVAVPNQIDWLNVHYFDYRGLIEKGLALEAHEGMYNIKDK